MSLPSGYRKLEYIQSSGTQYIDIGVKPNHGYAIEIKAKCSATSKQTFGGCDTSWKSNGFMLSVAGFEFGNNANTSLQNHGSEPITLKLSADGGYKNGTKTWDTSAIPAFQATANFTLCALNRSGTPQEYLNGNIYYCKIWDDSGTLIRDCIPCKSTSGVVGLWDDVNSVFYQNAGTGTFTSGPEVKGTNKTLIGGTGYDLKSGRLLIGGTGYAVKKGRALIDGAGYDVKLSNALVVSITGYNAIAFGTPAWKVTIDGTEYTTAEEIEVESGTEVTVVVLVNNGWMSQVASKKTGYIKFNGTVISGGYIGNDERVSGTYTFLVTADCKIACEGTFSSSQAQGIAEITM